MLEAIPTNFFSTRFRFQDGNQLLGEIDDFEGERQVGGIYPVAIFTRRSAIELPSDWPRATRIFLFWLAFVMWKRQNAAAA